MATVFSHKGGRSLEAEEFATLLAQRYRVKGEKSVIKLRSDGEASLKSAMEQTARPLINAGIDCTYEAVPKEKPWTNGRAEVRVRHVKELLGIQRAEVEKKLGRFIPNRSKLWICIVRHVGFLMN